MRIRMAVLIGVLFIVDNGRSRCHENLADQQSPPETSLTDQQANSLAEELRFVWRPPDDSSLSYDFSSPLDQHQIVVFPGIRPGSSYPVVVAMHGQPARGKLPRDYQFFRAVHDVVASMLAEQELPPLVLVMPAFRFFGQNWPKFDLQRFREAIEGELGKRHIQGSDYIIFGHSGAAGCGGDGMNRAHRIKPKAVGFFDTCLGRGWQEEVSRLARAHINTVNIHSVETAGFRPRQRPEYQASFDFGRAYGPLGMRPVSCPKVHPGERLRDQPYKCAASADGIVTGFVVDSGEGEEAHKALLPIAVRYFLKMVLAKSE